MPPSHSPLWANTLTVTNTIHCKQYNRIQTKQKKERKERLICEIEGEIPHRRESASSEWWGLTKEDTAPTEERVTFVSAYVTHRTSHIAHHIRHTSHVAHHTSRHIIRHVTHQTSHITHHTSQIMSHITHHTSHIMSHIIRHTSRIIRHTSRIIRHTSSVISHITSTVTVNLHAHECGSESKATPAVVYLSTWKACRRCTIGISLRKCETERVVSAQCGDNTQHVRWPRRTFDGLLLVDVHDLADPLAQILIGFAVGDIEAKQHACKPTR